MNRTWPTQRLEVDADGIATLTFDDQGAKVNTMSVAWQRDLVEAVDALVSARDGLRGVLLASAKSTFFAGAELNGVLRLREADAPVVFHRVEALKKSLRVLDLFGRPVVALLGGAALGGGWEVALAAHARFALDDASIRFGTPEVTLGLIPGAGGITKTVRKLGLMAANPYLVEGRLFPPREALELGWVEALCADAGEMRTRALEWIAAHPNAAQPWDAKDWRIPGGTPTTPKIAAALTVAPAVLAKETRGLYPAPQAILEAMVEGAQVDVDTALRIESRKLAGVMTSQVARNMITANFFGMNAIRSGRSRPDGVPRWKASRVGVLGAGMMGAGIAHAHAARGIACVLKDVSADKANAGLQAIEKILAPQVQKGLLDTAAAAALLARVKPTADVHDLVGCDLVIEAVFEQRALKVQVTQEAEPLLAPGGVFASNTSTLPISGLAQASRAPERFVGLHFFSPVHRMKLVEIIRGRETSDETMARAYDHVLALGKLPIVVNDSRGFFTSRVFGTFVMEGAAMLAEGVPAVVIESAARAVGMPVGPLAALDETSLVLSLHVLEQTRADFAAEARPYQASPGETVVERMVKQLGRSGRAAGGGFYDYPVGEPKRLWPGLAEAFGSTTDATELARYDARAVRALGERLLVRQSVEAARCLAEGVLASVHDANIGSIFGIGFPAWTGGAIQYIAAVGEARFALHAEALAAAHGPGFYMPREVRDTVSEALARSAGEG